MNTATAMALFCVAIYCLLKARGPRPGAAKAAKRPGNRYPGASIGQDGSACPTARTLSNKRFLAWEAPSIPLPGCNAQTCKCHYIFHADRRAEDKEGERGRAQGARRRLGDSSPHRQESLRGGWPDSINRPARRRSADISVNPANHWFYKL